MSLKEVFDAFCICDGHMCSAVYQWPWDTVAEGMGWADASFPPEGGKNTYSLDTKDSLRISVTVGTKHGQVRKAEGQATEG